MKNNFPRLEKSPQLHRKMTEVARKFRKEPTKSEAILWQVLRGKKLDGVKFRRQQPVGQFVVDFYNSVYRLAIEIDGPVHEHQKEADEARDEILEAVGLHVIRIKSETVEKNLPVVLDMIRTKIEEIKKTADESPSPILGEGLGERM